jgi:hypothetical protein
MVSHAADNGAGGSSPTVSDPPTNEDEHVSKSRRGLLAAGLAVAVAGSLGIISTMNAGAEETPAAPAASTEAPEQADVAVEPDQVSTPPTKLPWGTRPKKLEVGDPDADSDDLAATGADIAAPESPGDIVPEPEFAPKGYTSDNGTLKTETTTVAPLPPAAGRRADPSSPVHFFYGGASQFVYNIGTYANLIVGAPDLASNDFHSLSELAVQSADGRQIVEVGWNVDRTVNGNDDPHLFVYHWVDRTESCYNGCGFVPYSTTAVPGLTLPSGVSKQFGIQYFNGDWWIAYDSEWVGYFPGTLWNGNFNHSGLLQWFGEVAASGTAPCTQMGNGLTSSSGDAARVGSISLLGTATPVTTNVQASSTIYPVSKLSERTFRYGSPGAC